MTEAGRLGELATELDSLGEALGEAAMDVLREGIEAGDEASRLRAVASEKALNRARAATDKAARLVREALGGREETDF